jgi:hypothetical protein
MTENNKIEHINNPANIWDKIKNDFSSEYEFLAIRPIVVSANEDMILNYKNRPEPISRSVKNVEYISHNGINLDKIQDNIVPVEKAILENMLPGKTVAKFMDANNSLTDILNQTTINEEQKKSVRYALIVYDPIIMRKSQEPECQDKNYDVLLSENARLRDRSILKIYVNDSLNQ